MSGNWQALYSNETDADSNYIAPGLDCVAWCWNAPTEFTNAANTNGATLASSGRVNTDAGFSIYSYTGTQTPSQTVRHGLSKAPDLVIYKSRDEATNWVVGSSALGASDYMLLDVANKAASNATYIPDRPDAAVLKLGQVSSVNGSSKKMIAYCWHSVPGYSAFGSYTGNSNSNGPFIYTFPPCFSATEENK